MTQLPAHRWLLVAEVPQAHLVVPGLQLLPQRGKGCCGAQVLPSCPAVLDVENEQNVTGCQCPGKQVKPLINISGLESYSPSDAGLFLGELRSSLASIVGGLRVSYNSKFTRK